MGQVERRRGERGWLGSLLLFKAIGAFALISLTNASGAHAFAVIPLLGASLTGPVLDEAQTGFSGSFSTYRYGGGIGLEARMWPQLTMEVDGLYISRGYVENRSIAQEVRFNAIQIAAMVRYHFSPGFSLGFGGAFVNGLNPIQTFPTSNPTDVTLSEFNTGNFTSDDWGPLLSLRVRIGLTRGIGVVVDTRLFYGLANFSLADGVETYLYDIQAFVGVQIGPVFGKIFHRY